MIGRDIDISRRSAAAIGLLALAGLMSFLPWTTGLAPDEIGVRHDEGFLLLVVCGIAIALVVSGAKPAWMPAGFAVAGFVRVLVRLSDEGASAALPVYAGLGCALVAVGLLIADLLAVIRSERQPHEA